MNFGEKFKYFTVASIDGVDVVLNEFSPRKLLAFASRLHGRFDILAGGQPIKFIGSEGGTGRHPVARRGLIYCRHRRPIKFIGQIFSTPGGRLWNFEDEKFQFFLKSRVYFWKRMTGHGPENSGCHGSFNAIC
jgi:hypothetical protein